MKKAILVIDIVSTTHQLTYGIQPSFSLASGFNASENLIIVENKTGHRSCVYIANLFGKFFNPIRIFKVTEKHGSGQIEE